MTATALRPSTSPPPRREIPALGRSSSGGSTHRRTLLVGTALAAGACFAILSLLNAPGVSTNGSSQFAQSSEQQCARGVAVACNNLGVLHQQGQTVTADDRRSAELFDRACRGGYPEACNNLGAMYEHGAGVAIDVERARALYERACDQGAPLGCSNLGALYAQGKNVAPDVVEARRLFRIACDGGSAVGCDNLSALSAGTPALAVNASREP